MKTSNLELLLVLALAVGCADTESGGATADGGAASSESSSDDADGSEATGDGPSETTSDALSADTATDDDESSEQSSDESSTEDDSAAGESSVDDSDRSDEPGTETEPEASSSADSLSATGDDTSSTEPVILPDPVDLATLCELMREAWTADCEATSAYEDCAEAATLASGQQRCEAVAVAVDAGRLNYDGVQAALCIDAGSIHWVDAWSYGIIPDADCEGLMVSTALPSEACYSDETFQEPCATGYCNRREGCPGVCTEYLLPGASCDGGVSCDPSAFCNQAGECQVYGLEGEQCGPHECLFPLVCFNGSCQQSGDVGAECNEQDAPCADLLVCLNGVCEDSVPAGEICTFSVQCPADHSCLHSPPGGSELRCEPVPEAGEACDVRDGNNCAEPDGQCSAAEGGELIGSCSSFYVGDGADCGDGVGNCADEFYCRQGADPALGTCVPDVGEEEGCGDAVFQGLFNNPCLEGLHCMVTSSNTCLPPSPLDGPCFYNNVDSCVDGLFCDIVTSSCVEPKALGERCSPSDPEGSCQTGLCELVPAEDCENAPFGDCEDAICNALRANGEVCDGAQQCLSGHCSFLSDPALCAEPPPETTPWCVAAE